MKAKGSIVVCGLGSDPPRTLTFAVLHALSGCDPILAADANAAQVLRPHLPSGRRIAVVGSPEKKSVEEAAKGKRVGVAVPGNPLLFSDAARPFVQACAEKNLPLSFQSGVCLQGLGVFGPGRPLVKR